MVKRSRTGCLTCRQRKLKCSEEKPVCAQCLKANRECLASTGITFRHQQNPSMNHTDHGQGSLKNFYGYKETFAKETTWVQVPSELRFVHTSNPYDDEPEDGQYAPEGDTSFMTDASGPYQEAGANHGDYPMMRELAQAVYPAYATQGLEALSAVASQDQYSYAPPPAPMSQHEQTPSQQHPTTSPQNSHANTNPNLNFILNPSSSSGVSPENGNIDPQLHSGTPASHPAHAAPGSEQYPPNPEQHVRTYSYGSSLSGGRPSLHAKGPHDGTNDRRAAIESPELAFLLRDYAERCGLWMDLFELNLFFSATVPVLAMECPLLLYSCVAISAKSLARVDGRKPVMGGQVTHARQSRMEAWPGSPMGVDEWTHKAREYYDLAVSLLRQALAGATRPPTSSLPDHASPSSISAAQGYPLPTTDADELVAATAILCVYKFLDASGPEWSRHLDGAKSLFDIANDRMVHITLPPSPVSMAHKATQALSDYIGSTTSEPPRPNLSKGRRAVFWNFARQDMLSAFINNTSTRLDTSDLAMWRSAGLKITAEGFICPSNPQHPDFRPENAMREDMISNAFIWLMCKLVNYIAAGDDVPQDVSDSQLRLGVLQRELLEYWEGLDAQFSVWYQGLPNSLLPTAICMPNHEVGIEEKWFSRPMCASTAQWWHFGRIQLLHNKPHVTTATPFRRGSLTLGRSSAGISLATRHASYNSILQQSREHAKEIVAIGLGRSDEGTRVHSVQPLWTAGLVLGIAEDQDNVNKETWMWRRSILTQLRGIERDMGWASEYRVRSLLQLWNLPMDWGLDLPG